MERVPSLARSPTEAALPRRTTLGFDSPLALTVHYQKPQMDWSVSSTPGATMVMVSLLEYGGQSNLPVKMNVVGDKCGETTGG